METMVHKATNSKVMPPKRKHVRNIIMETWKEMGGNHFYNEIFKRPLESSDTTAWKALITIHTVVQQGHPKLLDDGYIRLSFFDSIRNTYNRQTISFSGHQLNKLITIYSTFLSEKLTFHNIYKGFPGDFSLEKYTKSNRDDPMKPELRLQCVIHMLDLQAAINNIQKSVLEIQNLDECKVSALLPLVVESYNLYTLEVLFIKKLVQDVDSMDILSHLIERFYEQYISLRKFYFDVSTIKYVSSIIAVPMLPKDPPTFSKPKEASPSPRLSRRQHREAPKPVAAAPPPAPRVQEFQPVHTPSFVPTPEQMQVVTRPNPTPPVVYNPPPVTTPAPAPQKVVVEKPKDFSDLAVFVDSLKTQVATKNQAEEERKKQDELRRRQEEEERKRIEEEKRFEEERKRLEMAQIKTRQEEERRKAEEIEKKRREAERQRVEEEDKRRLEAERVKREDEQRKKVEMAERQKREEERLALEQERIRKIVHEEASKEIRELKVRVVELENSVEREKEKALSSYRDSEDLRAKLENALRELENQRKINAELRRALDERDATISRMTESQKSMAEDYEQLKASFATMRNQHEAENARAIAKEIGTAIESVEMYLSRLDNPTNLGNPSATPADVMDDTEKLAKVSEAFIDVIIANGGREQFIDGVRAMTATCSNMLDDAKGASRRIEDNGMRQKLLDAARYAGEATQSLLDLVKSLEGTVESEDEKKELYAALSDTKTKLTTLSKAAADSENVPEDNNEDFEDLAEKELLAAAKIIEQAANDLLAAKSKQKAAEPGTPDVAQAIMEAAMAITKATGLLVQAATSAQKERIEKGRAGTGGAVYRRDPTWSQGLISAAKAVAHATSTLVATANDAALGKIDEENLIAASKAVAGSTAQLVAATRAKSDPNSPTQAKLNTAAKAVTDATSMLVAAAKAAAARKEEEAIDVSIMTEMQRKTKEMETQADILRIEKELENTRKKLFALRKQQYM